MKYTDFNYSGGFPLDQSVLKRMQQAYFEHMEAYARQLGCESVGNYILDGCKVVGANITPGMMFIDGEMCPFAGAVGTIATKIKKITTTANAPFENGTNPPVFKETIAQVDASGILLSAFTRFFPVFDENYVHTDNNFTAAFLAKLNSIATGAEVNVQADWAVTNPALDSFIKNKPVGQYLLYLRKGTFIHGDLITDKQLITVTFPTVGTSNYTVLASLVGEGSWQAEVNINFGIREKTETYFKIMMTDYSNSSSQIISFDYIIIPN